MLVDRTSPGFCKHSTMDQTKLHPLERLPDDFKDPDVVETPLDQQPIAPDQFVDGYEATKWEIWAFYSYFTGNSGLGLFTFAPTALQSLLSQAVDDTGLLPFAGQLRNINSIILLSDGISFSISVVILIVLGSYADFGTLPFRSDKFLSFIIFRVLKHAARANEISRPISQVKFRPKYEQC